MSRFFKKALSLCLVAALAVTVASCGEIEGTGRRGTEKVDHTKTQIYVGLYNGGLGNEWMKKIKEAFETKYPEYQVIIEMSKANFGDANVLNNFDSFQSDLFILDYVENVNFTQFIRNGYTADITDIVHDEKLTEYNEDVSIYDKMNDSLKAYFYEEGKSYAVPWYQASYQTIYDKAIFKEYELYKNADGEWNDGSDKHLGIDGVKSFDDGLPRTMAEYKELIEYMKSNECNLTPYTFYGNGSFYSLSYLASVYADYEGKDDFMLNLTFNGTDSDIGEITLDNGYLLKTGQTGKRYSLELAYYIAHDAKNYSRYAFSTSQDNTTSQREFLLSRETDKPIAMIIEGPWWETEAKQVFTDMADTFREPSYAYGKREFGVLPIPKADDGTSAEGRTICAVSGRSMMFVNGKRSAEKIANAKKLLKFMHTNDALNIEIAYSNVVRPFAVDMKDEYLSLMTPYGKELTEVYESSTVVYENMPNCSFLRYEGTGFCNYIGLFRGFNLTDFMPTKSTTVDNALTNMATDKAAYDQALAEYRVRING